MSEYGIVTEAGPVRFERLLPGPIERVWAYLTDAMTSGSRSSNPFGRRAIARRGASNGVQTDRSSMRSILIAMMKSFSCRPLIFLVLREMVA
jgi:hypothetical protein